MITKRDEAGHIGVFIIVVVVMVLLRVMLFKEVIETRRQYGCCYFSSETDNCSPW